MKHSFTFKQFEVRQERCAMKVGTDGVLLGAWARVEHCERILDMGTGTGLVALMAAQRSQANIVAIDLDADAVAQAAENIAASPWKDRIQVLEADARKLSHLRMENGEWRMENACASERNGSLPAISQRVQPSINEVNEQKNDSQLTHPKGNNSQFSILNSQFFFDSLLCNPPFFENSLKCPDSARTMARHTDTLSFDDLARSAARLLSPEGELSVVIPYDRAHDMTVSAACHGLFATHQTVVVPVEGGKPKRILMAFTREGAAHAVETLCIQDAQRNYTPAYIHLVGDFYLKM